MDVGLGDLRQVVVDDQRQLVDVDAARCDVGGDQHAAGSALEVVHRLHAGVLRLVAVNGARLDAGAVEDLGQLVGAVLGACEDQHLLCVGALQQVDQQPALFGLLGEMDPLRDGLDDRGRRRDGHQHGVVQDFGGQLGDVRGHRGREKERLPPCGQQRQDAADVVDEAHVQHAVGLVEDEEADLVQRDMALPDEVQQAARGGDQQVHAPLQRIDLRTLVDASEDHAVADGEVAGVVAAAFVDLDGQLARRRDDQGADFAAAFGGGLCGQELEDGQRESCGLARPGLCAALQVAAFECGRDGLLLNGGRIGVPLFPDGAQQRLGES